MTDPAKAYVRIITYPEPKRLTDVVHTILDAMPVDKLTVPSLPDYFKGKLERTATQAGLAVVESDFRNTSIIVERSATQMRYPQYNQFSLEQGSSNYHTNTELKNSGSNNVIEKASILVFVAKKAA